MGEEKKTRYHAIEDWMLKDPFFNAGARFKIYIIIRNFTVSAKTGKCFYSLSDFEEKAGLQRRVVGRALQDLQENGYITIEKDGQKNTYKSVEKINVTRDKMSLDKMSLVDSEKVGTNCPYTRDKLSPNQGQIVPTLGTKCPQHPNSSLIESKLNTNSKEAVNICLLNNTPSQDGQKKVTENDKNEEPETTPEKAITATADGINGNNGNYGYPAPPVENPSLSLTDDGNDNDPGKADDKATAEETATTPTLTEDRDKEILDRILAERPLEEIMTEKLMAIYPPSKVDITSEEVIFRLRNIQNLEAETVYLLTLVKETMDINPYYVPKLSRYLDQGSYLQHFRVRMPLNEFSADFLVKKEWEAKMTEEDWKEAGDLLLRNFDMSGDGFRDPLPESSEREKAEALAWLESLGQKKTGGAKQ